MRVGPSSALRLQLQGTVYTLLGDVAALRDAGQDIRRDDWVLRDDLAEIIPREAIEK